MVTVRGMNEPQDFRAGWHLPASARVSAPQNFETSAEEALLWYDGPIVVIAHAEDRRWLAVNSDERCEIIDGARYWTVRWVCAEITEAEATVLRAKRGTDWRDRKRSLWTRRPVLVVDQDNSGTGREDVAWLVPARSIKDHLPVMADPARTGQWSDKARRRRQRRTLRTRLARIAESKRRMLARWWPYAERASVDISRSVSRQWTAGHWRAVIRGTYENLPREQRQAWLASGGRFQR